MAEIKTKTTTSSVKDFLNSIEQESKRQDGFALLELFEDVTDETAVMWGTSIVGFGTYHYKSARSRQEGDWPRVGFSPRKQNLTLYLITTETDQNLLRKLGKHKTSVSCLYINNLADVDLKVVEQLVREAWDYMEKRYPTK